MKIHANLLSTRPRLAMPLAVFVWGLSAAMVTGAVMLTLSAFDMRDEAPRLQQRLSRLSEQIKNIEAIEAVPPSAELNEMRQRVAALNSLTGMLGWSTPQVLVWLENKMPDNVYLVSFHHKPREGEILFVAESTSAEFLTAFLLRLEKEPHFSEVLLNKQGMRTGSGPSVLQFEVRARQKS